MRVVANQAEYILLMDTNNISFNLRKLNEQLRNSLTGILGNAIFLSEGTLTLEQQYYVNAIMKCANDLKLIADNMLLENNLGKHDSIHSNIPV